MNQMSVHRLYPATHTHGLCKYSVYSVLKFQWITCLNSVTEINVWFTVLYVLVTSMAGGGGGGYYGFMKKKVGRKNSTFILVL